ncbi:hypothetical protein Ssi03_60530 [Sphaerisporangium siamense]|uniref:DUF3048 domain-containing protein n=1 Tax=Sphaerisporangium siamense TaxID=795645 RepID=A0A7W7GC94_9ACTN|nr:DUF3048 domain-containing protein [Sphaerisporangium siamense]MBB4703284.1 hypothetical protein [Sphaerisporangium siamense]GII88063.1 hypothetical protein Ssi03_60530 [Sphaerisporangium siamense]
MRVKRVISVALAGTAVLTPAAACSSSGGGASPAGEATQPVASPSSSPAPPPEHPFTGRPVAGRKPVLAVKIENTAAGKPQLGLRSADLVFVEQVEGGLTRLMAIFSSKLPAKIGPVRSARISDLHLLPMFGKPALAYSGVQSKMIPLVQAASLFDVSDSAQPGAYFRQPGRVAPYNLFADTKKLLAGAPKASRARDIGFTFGDAPDGGTPRKTFTVKYPAARFTFTWSEDDKRWLVAQDGKRDMAAEGGQLGAPTIVVQYAKTTRSEFHDFTGSYTPLIQSTGTGRAVVLRDGKAYKAKWSRPSEKEGTTFTTASGDPLPFSRGQVWIVLAAPKPVQP